MIASLTSRLSEFATAPVSVPAGAARVAAMSGLDWMAVGSAGADEPVSDLMRKLAVDEGGRPEAHVFGSGIALPARAAAQANGTISHALDYDDTHFAHIGHPSVAVFPAVLALAERDDRPLSDMLEAALLGMEVSIRLGLWLGRSHYQAGFHQTATAGAFGAAAGAGRMLGLDAREMAQALGLAATRAAGIKAQFGTMGKPYNAGLAPLTGVEVAVLARSGFTANPDAIEGVSGFGALHHGAGDAEAALDGLGAVWLFEGVSHKYHACCHGLHAALEAARELDLAEPEIEDVTVRTHPRWMSVCNQPAPVTGLGAKFSYATVIAMQALGHDTARLDVFSDRIATDPRLSALRERVLVIEDPELTETQAVVSVLRRDGQRLEARHDLMAPMSLADREARVRAKAASLIGEEAASGIWALLTSGAQARELSPYMISA